MSYHKVRDIPIEPNVVRDFRMSFAKSSSFTIDLYQQYLVVGLDWSIHNRGSSALTVAIDKQDPVTVGVNESYSESNVKFSLVEVTASGDYDLVVMGKHAS